MNLPSPHIARFQRPTVLDSWSPVPVPVKTVTSGNHDNDSCCNRMLLNRWRELGQERNGESSTDTSSSRVTPKAPPFFPVAGYDSDMDIIDSNSDEVPSENPRLSVNKSNGHISIVPGSTSTLSRRPIENGDGVSSGRPHASVTFDQPPQNVLPSPVVTEQGEEADDELPLVFLGLTFGIIPSQWYPKSLSKWHSGVKALGGRFITPPTESVPDLVLLPLSDERSDLATPVEADVPEHWLCPIAVTSWITQCVMAGKLFELDNPEVPILGLDPLTVRVLERSKKGPFPSETPLSVADANSNANLLQGLSAQIVRMGESMASQSAAVNAFADGQGALHSQMRQMAAAINTLTEQLHRSHQATSLRIDHLSGLIQHRGRQSQARDFHESSSKIYAAVTDEARRASHSNRREAFVPSASDRVGAAQRPSLHFSSPMAVPQSFVSPVNGVGVRTSTLTSRAGPLPSPPDHDTVVSLPDTPSNGHHPPSSQRKDLLQPSANGANHMSVSCSSRSGDESSSRDTGRSERATAAYLNVAGVAASNPPAANTRDSSEAATVSQLGPLATISPSELQSLLRNVFSEAPQKDHEVFWRRARSIYIEHLGQRAPPRVSITHVSQAQAVLPNRYLYDKIIFVSTVPGEDALAILFDMQEKEVVIYDTIDRYRNNLFTFGKEKTLAESFGLKDAAWYVVELVAQTEREDSFPLVCLATKIFASRDRKSFRDLFPPHVVVAKKNIKNPIPPRRQAKADYYWRLVRPRVVQHLVKELSAVLLTRYRHEETYWVNVPKCSEWVEGLTRFEDSEEAKELPDGRFKVEDGSRPLSRDKKEGGPSAMPSDSTPQNGRVEEPATSESQSCARRAADEPEQPERHGRDAPAHTGHPENDLPSEYSQAREIDSDRQQQKRPAEAEPVEDPVTKKQRVVDSAQNMPSQQDGQSQAIPSPSDNQ